MRQPSRHRVARGARAAAATTPLVGLDDPASQNRSIRLEPLPEDFEAELVQPGERGQVKGRRR
jgi:hypothetical protein